MLIEWIKNIFSELKNKIRRTNSEERRTQKDALAYYDTSKENVTAIVARALSIIAFTDSSLNITAEDMKVTKRTKLIIDVLSTYISKCKKKRYFFLLQL